MLAFAGNRPEEETWPRRTSATPQFDGNDYLIALLLGYLGL
jgi:hypothetical protein